MKKDLVVTVGAILMKPEGMTAERGRAGNVTGRLTPVGV